MILNVETCERNIRKFKAVADVFSSGKVISKVYTNNKQKTTCSDKSFFCLEKSRTDRFEPSNATVRWTVAGDGLTEPNLNIFFPKERKYVTNLAGTCLDD